MNHTASLKKIRDTKGKSDIYLAVLLLSFHVVFIVYSASSYLSIWFSSRSIGFLYITSSIIAIGLFAIIPKLVSSIGNKNLMVSGIALEIITLIGLSIGSSLDRITIAIFFIAHNVLVSMLYYNLDIFLEENSTDESTGEIRGAFLTVSNITYVITPTLAGLLISWGGYPSVYILSIAFLLPLFALVVSRFQNHIKKNQTNIFKAASRFLKKRDLRHVFIANFILNFFYAWMTIYTPLYLATILGFEWQKIGVMFSIMLLPFLLFQLPLGKIADKYLGEKEIMTTGFFILSLSTIILAFLPKSFFLWVLFLFMTRVGASAIEIMIETYFFKKVDSTDTEEIGFFRMSRSFGILVAPTIAAGTLYSFSFTSIPFKFSFIVLGALCILGIIPSLLLRDTK